MAIESALYYFREQTKHNRVIKKNKECIFAKSVTMHEYFNYKIVEKMELKIFFLIYSRLGFKDI